MIRIDPSDWKADFRIARALAEAYHASGLDDTLFLCMGDPEDTVGRLGPIVGDETLKYFPNVRGTTEDPLTPERLEPLVAELREGRRNAFVVAVESGIGAPQHLGSVEITDRDPHMLVQSGLGITRISDVTVSVVLRIDPVYQDTPADRETEDTVAADVLADARGSSVRPRLFALRGGRSRGLDEAVREVGSDEPGALLGRKKKFKPLLPHEIDARMIQKLADTVIDGNLRFLSKIGKQEI